MLFDSRLAKIHLFLLWYSEILCYSKILRNLNMNMLNANTATKKRSHVELKVPQNKDIIDYKKKFPKSNLLIEV